MKINLLAKITLVLLSSLALIFFFHKKNKSKVPAFQIDLHQLNPSGAGKSLDAWFFERAYPNDKLAASKYLDAFDKHQINLMQRTNGIEGEWESLGPKNIGGRTLCLAFHPTDPDVIFAGSASGGLWKTTTQGIGEDAWEFVPTGFPVLGVASIAIHPDDPNTMLIGTGETYGVGIAQPGTVNRYTRGTYGIGILKTTDGGSTWSQVLSFEMKDIKGVQDIEISQQNNDEIYAATTDGVYQSVDGGDSWSLIFAEQNCVDLLVDPNDGNIIYVSSGNFNYDLDPTLSGIFKSTDKGNSFTELLDQGLLGAWSGNAKLDFDPTNSNTLFAEIQVGWFNTDPTTPAGIYKSTDAGDTWTKINDQNIALYQGWYSHDFAINPNNTDEMVYVGIEAWRSTDAGASFSKKSIWSSWQFGPVPVDVPEGGDEYVHADIHAAYYHPLVENMVLLATDGGMFVSEDGGETFETRTGGMQTTQFYANIASSTTNPDFLIAGTQDNATWIYDGTSTWSRTIGGDGMSAAVHPTDDQIVFGSAQRLNIFKSTDGGAGFYNVKPSLVQGDFTAFAGPYEIAPSSPNIMYAGATYLYKSTDAAENWAPTSNQSVDGINVITNIAISPDNADLLFVATAPDPLAPSEPAKVLKSTDGGQTFSVITGLPDRVCKDIVFGPANDDIIYAVFSGFETDHVYRSNNTGTDWFSIDNGLPDVPTNTILVDPMFPLDLYIGNDLGVYYSGNSGLSWETFCEALPEATIVMHLDVSVADRKLRVATHGRGIYQRDLVSDPMVDVPTLNIANTELKIFPNPASGIINIELEMDQTIDFATVEIYDAIGKKVATIFKGKLNIGINNFLCSEVEKLASGTYFVQVKSNGKSISKPLIVK